MPAQLSLIVGDLSVWNDPDRCATCNRTINRDAASLGVQRRPVRPFALSLSSDGFFIASEAFHRLAGEHAFEGVTFVPLQNRYAVIKLRRQVAYSAIQSISLGQVG